MPVGERIFGNIRVNHEDAFSHIAYFLNVSDCSTPSILTFGLTPKSAPIIRNATCLANSQLMIALEFEPPLLGQYQTLVDGIPYQLASVVNQPSMLFFSGAPPPEGTVTIRSISATDNTVIFDETYTPPVCDSD
jgi:hypothetical protein